MIGGWSILHHLKRLVAWTKGTQGTNVLLGWFHDAAFESFKEATSSDSLQRVNALGSSKKLQVCSFILDSFSLNCGLIGHNQCHIITYHRLRFFSSYWHGVFVIILVPVLGVPWLFAVWAPFFASFCINVFLATPPTLATCLASKCLSVRWECHQFTEPMAFMALVSRIWRAKVCTAWLQAKDFVNCKHGAYLCNSVNQVFGNNSFVSVHSRITAQALLA